MLSLWLERMEWISAGDFFTAEIRENLSSPFSTIFLGANTSNLA